MLLGAVRVRPGKPQQDYVCGGTRVFSGCMTATPSIWRDVRTRLFCSISSILDWVSASMRRLQPLYMLRMFTLRSSRDSWRRSQQRRF